MVKNENGEGRKHNDEDHDSDNHGNGGNADGEDARGDDGEPSLRRSFIPRSVEIYFPICFMVPETGGPT